MIDKNDFANVQADVFMCALIFIIKESILNIYKP